MGTRLGTTVRLVGAILVHEDVLSHVISDPYQKIAQNRMEGLT